MAAVIEQFGYILHNVGYRGSALYRGSFMSAHVLLNLLNEFGKSDKMQDLPSLINSIIQVQEC